MLRCPQRGNAAGLVRVAATAFRPPVICAIKLARPFAVTRTQVGQVLTRPALPRKEELGANQLAVERPVFSWVDTNAGQGRLLMTVKAILATKGTDVLSIEPTATLETAVKMLANHRIGALLVLGP